MYLKRYRKFISVHVVYRYYSTLYLGQNTIRHIYKNVYLEAIFLNWNAKKKLRINNNSIKQMYMYVSLFKKNCKQWKKQLKILDKEESDISPKGRIKN